MVMIPMFDTSKKVLLVAVSKDTSFKLNREYVLSLGVCDYIQIENNSKPLSVLYNEILVKVRSDSTCTYKFIVFCHADVSFNLHQFYTHLESCSDKYDVFGLAGCEKISFGKSPLNWFTGSADYPESRWGSVIHGELNNQQSFFNRYSTKSNDHHVVCIDGLCIVFGKNAIESKLQFDTKFSFDFYDTDISFTCIIKEKLRLGVLVEPTLHHYSVGKSILTKEFLKSEAVFRQKWTPVLNPKVNHKAI